jgi:hypothetical protein
LQDHGKELDPPEVPGFCTNDFCVMFAVAEQNKRELEELHAWNSSMVYQDEHNLRLNESLFTNCGGYELGKKLPDPTLTCPCPGRHESNLLSLISDRSLNGLLF